MKTDKSDRRLFIFDDDPSLVGLLQRITSTEYNKIFTATTCPRALELINVEARDFDIIMTDLHFPDGSGLDILRAAKKKSLLTVVALFTGFASLESAIRALNEGAFDYITKPFTIEQIMALLNKMEGHIHLQKENIELRSRMTDAASQANRQFTKFDQLLEEMASMRGMLMEHSVQLKRILDSLDALRTPRHLDISSKT